MSAESAHRTGLTTYLAVFATLLLLTGLTVWVAFQDFGAMNNVLAIGIAVVKSTLVVLFFMHVLHSSPLTKIVLVIALGFFLLMVSMIYADTLTRGMLEITGRAPIIGG